MSTTDDFPLTTVLPTEHRRSSARRTIEVHWRVDHTAGPLRGETYPPVLTVASVESFQSNGGEFSTPRLVIGRDQLNFTRAEWERVKREVDQAWGVFETTWPASADGR